MPNEKTGFPIHQDTYLHVMTLSPEQRGELFGGLFWFAERVAQKGYLDVTVAAAQCTNLAPDDKDGLPLYGGQHPVGNHQMAGEAGQLSGCGGAAEAEGTGGPRKVKAWAAVPRERNTKCCWMADSTAGRLPFGLAGGTLNGR